MYIAPSHSSATRVLMDSFTVIFLNTTPAEPNLHFLVKKGLQTL